MTALSSRRRPVQTTTVDPRVLEKALEIANGDHRRLEPQRDGSVVVVNNPRKGR